MWRTDCTGSIHLPSLTEDFARLADVAEVYGDAAPDLMEILRNTVTTSRTLVEQGPGSVPALTTTATAAGTADDFLDANGDPLITLLGSPHARPLRPLLARVPLPLPAWCARSRHPSRLSGAAGCTSRSKSLRRRRNEPGEYPRYDDRSGPNCRDLPHPPVPAPGVHLNDGSAKGGSSGPGGVSTRAEQRAVGSLVAPVMGVPTRYRRSRRCCSGRWRAGRR